MKKLVTNWLVPLAVLASTPLAVHYYDWYGLYVVGVVWIAYLAFVFSQERNTKELTAELNSPLRVSRIVKQIRPRQRIETITDGEENE